MSEKFTFPLAGDVAIRVIFSSAAILSSAAPSALSTEIESNKLNISCVERTSDWAAASNILNNGPPTFRFLRP